ncbi:hypothetical protein [Rhodanobacter sp. DHB23]|uniref:hypothetical protein n=1 Tax=Rhodanobacter sp. DHB23 TaxID=2775923 RepID=UPI00177AAC29|nr:hypothetical protein [Rhodanobacter sp. DHB23]MBD8873842.1 hypothetical protein [Rhodanobacter sp. DHB23]
MADMQIAMRLTMADLASGPLGRFMSRLQELRELASKVTAGFNDSTKSMAGLGRGAGELEAALGTLGNKASTTSGQMSGLAEKLVDLAQGMVTLGETLKGGIASFNELGSSARMAGVGVAVGTREMGAANAKVKETTTSVGGLSSALKGMAEIWAAMKIDQGLKASVETAADYQDTLLKLKARNLSSGELSAIQTRARQESQQNPFYSTNDALKAELAALPGLPGTSQYMQDMRAQLVPYAMKVAQVLKLQGDQSPLEHQIQNIFGVVEAMGGAENADKAKWIMRGISDASVASGGKIDVKSLETSLRQLNRALSTNMTPDQFRNFVATNEEFKAAGGGGAGGNTKAATILNAIYTASAGGVMKKGGADLLEQLGVLDPSKVSKYGHSSTQAMVAPGALKDSQLAISATNQWVREVLVPALTKYTWQHWQEFGYASNSPKDLENPQEMANAVANLGTFLSKMGLGGQTFASGLAMLSNPAVTAAIDAQVAQQKSTRNPDDLLKERQQTFSGAMQSMHAQLETLENTIGQQLNPTLTKLTNWFSSVIKEVNDLAQKYPTLTKYTAEAAAGFAAFLAIKGLSSMIGGITSLVGWMGKIGPAATAAAAETTVAEAAIGTAAATAAVETEAATATIASRWAALLPIFRNVVAMTPALTTAAFVATASGDTGQDAKVAEHQAAEATTGKSDAASNALTLARTQLSHWWRSTPTDAEIRDRAADIMTGHMGGESISDRNTAAYKKAYASIDADLSSTKDQANASSKAAATSAPAPEAALVRNAAQDNPGETEAQHQVRQAKEARVPGGNLGDLGKDTAAGQSTLQKLRETIEEQDDKDKGDPFDAVMRKYQGYSDQFRKAGDGASADRALQVGNQQANKAAYDYESQKLEQLKQELEAQKQLNAAKREAGEISKEQEGRANLAATQKLVPQMQQAATAGARYAQAMGNPTLAMTKEAQSAAIGQLDTQAAKAITQAKLDDAMNQLKALQRTVQELERAQEAKYRGGQISHDQMVTSDNAIEQQRQPQMLALAQAAKEYASTIGNPELADQLDAQIAKIQQMGQALTQTAQQAQQLGQRIEDTVGQSFSDLFSSMMKGNQTWKTMLANLNNSLLGGFNKSISNYLGKQVETTVFGDSSKGNGGDGGGLLGGLLGKITGNGNSGNSGNQGAGGGSGGLLTNLLGKNSILGKWLNGSSGSNQGGSPNVLSGPSDALGSGEDTLGMSNAGQGGGFMSGFGALLGQNSLTGQMLGGSGGDGCGCAGMAQGGALGYMQQMGSLLANSDGSTASGGAGATGGGYVGMAMGLFNLFSTMASFAVGTDSVPHDMVAQIHAGERIIPAATNQALTEQLRNGGLGGGHQINLSIHAMDSQSVLGAMDGVKRELHQMLQNTASQYNMGTR